MKIRALILSLAILILAAFNLSSLVKEPQEFSAVERRPLKQELEISQESLVNSKLAAELETYLAEQFSLREEALGLKAELDRRVRLDNGRVYFGRDAYLISKYELDEASMERSVQHFADFLPLFQAAGGEEAYFILAPSLAGYSQEQAPPFMPTNPELAVINKANESLTEAGYQSFEVKEILDKSNSSHDFYYRTDHHWTQDAAYEVFLAYAKELGFSPADLPTYERELVLADFYGTNWAKASAPSLSSDELYAYTTDSLEQVKYETTELKTKGLYFPVALDDLDPYEFYLGKNQALIKLSTQAQSERKILVVKDSYANSFIPFLCSLYSEVYVLDLRHFTGEIKELVTELNCEELLILYSIENLNNDQNTYKLKPRTAE